MAETHIFPQVGASPATQKPKRVFLLRWIPLTILSRGREEEEEREGEGEEPGSGVGARFWIPRGSLEI